MSEPRETSHLEGTTCRRCSRSACPTTTRRQFMIASGASALSIGTMGLAGPAKPVEEPKSLLAPTLPAIKRCLLRVEFAGEKAALAQADSLSKALAATARKLDFDLDTGPQAGRASDGRLIVALDGKKNNAMALAAKSGTTPVVILCPRSAEPTPGAVWQLAESKAGLLVGSSKAEKDVVYGLRMLHAAWKLNGNNRMFRLSFKFKAYEDAEKLVRAEKSAQQDAEAFADYYMKNAVEIRRALWSDLVNAGMVYACLRRIISVNKYDGIGLAGCLQSYVVSGTNPCVAAMRLLDEGVPAACEGDMSGLEVQLLTHWLFGRPSFIGEGQPTIRNSRINAHCTSPSKLHGYDQPHDPFLLMPHSETGRGIAPQVKWPVGQEVTIFRGRNKIGTGQLLSNSLQPPNGGCRTSFEYTVDGVADVGRPATGLGSPHSEVVYGNFEKELDAFWTLVQGRPSLKFRDEPAPKRALAQASVPSPSLCEVPSCSCCRWAHASRG